MPPLLPIDSLVDEGLLIAAAGIRMAVKNQAIRSILRDGRKFALEWYLDRTRDQLIAFAAEKEADARRVAEAADEARNPSDYGPFATPGPEESDRLLRRQEMLSGLIDRLTGLASDDAYVAELALASRDAAWDEIGASIQASALRRVGSPPTLNATDREAALTDLRAQLAALEALPLDH